MIIKWGSIAYQSDKSCKQSERARKTIKTYGRWSYIEFSYSKKEEFQKPPK